MDLLSVETKEEAFNCEKHGAYKAQVWRLNTSSQWCKQECPECKKENDEAFRNYENEELARRHKQEIEDLKSKSLVPLRFRDKTFDNYIPDGDSKALKACREYAENFREHKARGRCLILCGTAGTGKTHLACSIIDYIITNHLQSAIYTTIGKAFRTIKSTYSRSSDSSEQKAYSSFVAPSLLVLDEIGVQYGSEAEKNILFEIINDRYENLKPTIIISNLAINTLTEFAGERVVDRLKENGGKLIIFDWKSYRAMPEDKAAA